ncbi:MULTISPECIES: hypothetical protein [unclassified Kribbella]|uniref:hypothetical protein n=1 Tax=unclassified Kribbella TaxID=2644121 RepID=UPI00301A73AD
MRNLLDFDDDGSILAVLRGSTDRELQRNIILLRDLRDHAAGWMAEQWQSVLLLACQVRDERLPLARAVDDAVNPFTVVGRIGEDT